MPVVLASSRFGRLVASVRVQRDVATVRDAFGDKTPVWEDVFTVPPPGRLVASSGGAEQGSGAGEALESVRRTVMVRWYPGFPAIAPYPKSRVLLDGETWRVLIVREQLQRQGEPRLMAIEVDRMDVV